MRRLLVHLHQGLQRREPHALAQVVVLVAISGTFGSVIGQWWFIVPATSFGNVGSWVAGSAAIAALLGISKQIEVARGFHTDDRDERRLAEWCAQCRVVCLDLHEVASVIRESEALGVAFLRSADDVRGLIRNAAGRLRALRSASAGLSTHPFECADPLFVLWLECSESGSASRVIVGFSAVNTRLLAALQEISVTPRD